MTKNGYISTYWPTPVKLGAFEPSSLINVSLVSTSEQQERFSLLTIGKELVDRLKEKALEIINELSAYRECGDTRVSVCRLSPGYYRTISYSPTSWTVWMCLDTTGSGLTPDSGALMLQDPRAGVGMVPLPGLPWGRSLNTPMTSGTYIAHPGWLGHSILPVSGDHTIIVAKLEVTY